MSAVTVIVIGSLLHFVWAWSGENPLVAIFAATNESTWEHLKMAFWPALLIAPVQYIVYGRPPGWLPATAIRVLLPAALIVAIFYGYTAVLGRNLFPLDIATFVVSVTAGELAGHAVMSRPAGAAVRLAAGCLIVLGVAAFSALTFVRPAVFLFDDPHGAGSGAHFPGPRPR